MMKFNELTMREMSDVLRFALSTRLVPDHSEKVPAKLREFVEELTTEPDTASLVNRAIDWLKASVSFDDAMSLVETIYTEARGPVEKAARFAMMKVQNRADTWTAAPVESWLKGVNKFEATTDFTVKASSSRPLEVKKGETFRVHRLSDDAILVRESTGVLIQFEEPILQRFFKVAGHGELATDLTDAQRLAPSLQEYHEIDSTGLLPDQFRMMTTDGIHDANGVAWGNGGGLWFPVMSSVETRFGCVDNANRSIVIECETSGYFERVKYVFTEILKRGKK